jgi:hypothetical protein
MLNALPEDNLATEAELVELARTNLEAFAELYRRYVDRVYRYLCTHVESDDDAADLTQQVFLRALQAMPAYRDEGKPFRVWLFRIARNAATDFPLLSIGGYLQTAVGIAIPGDLTTVQSALPLSYAEVQDSLKAGKPKKGASPTLVTVVNAEANIITALICHADGKRPSTVCALAAIKTILKHVK